MPHTSQDNEGARKKKLFWSIYHLKLLLYLLLTTPSPLTTHSHNSSLIFQDIFFSCIIPWGCWWLLASGRERKKEILLSYEVCELTCLRSCIKNRNLYIVCMYTHQWNVNNEINLLDFHFIFIYFPLKKFDLDWSISIVIYLDCN